MHIKQRATRHQRTDTELYNKILNNQDDKNALAEIFLKYSDFMMDEDVKKLNDLKYTDDYLKDVRKFIATLALVIRNNKINDPNSTARHGLDDLRPCYTSHFRSYLEDMIKTLSKHYFDMSFSDFVQQSHTRRTDKFKKASNTIKKLSLPIEKLISDAEKLLKEDPNADSFTLTRKDVELLVETFNSTKQYGIKYYDRDDR